MIQNSETILSLEEEIKSLYQKYLLTRLGYEGALLNELREKLSLRRDLINKDFQFTQQAVTHIERVNKLLIRATNKAHSKAIEINKLLNEDKQQGNELSQNYSLKASVEVGWSEGNWFLRLMKDENHFASDYVKMAEIIHETRRYSELRSFFFQKNINNPSQDISDQGLEEDELTKLNWNIEIFDAPELAHIPYVCYASHDLFHHHFYSLSDIIRITDIRCEIELQMTHRIK
jgi:hypothetical protein